MFGYFNDLNKYTTQFSLYNFKFYFAQMLFPNLKILGDIFKYLIQNESGPLILVQIS